MCGLISTRRFETRSSDHHVRFRKTLSLIESRNALGWISTAHHLEAILVCLYRLLQKL